MVVTTVMPMVAMMATVMAVVMMMMGKGSGALRRRRRRGVLGEDAGLHGCREDCCNQGGWYLLIHDVRVCLSKGRFRKGG